MHRGTNISSYRWAICSMITGDQGYDTDRAPRYQGANLPRNLVDILDLGAMVAKSFRPSDNGSRDDASRWTDNPQKSTASARRWPCIDSREVLTARKVKTAGATHAALAAN